MLVLDVQSTLELPTQEYTAVTTAGDDPFALESYKTALQLLNRRVVLAHALLQARESRSAGMWQAGDAALRALLQDLPATIVLKAEAEYEADLPAAAVLRAANKA